MHRKLVPAYIREIQTYQAGKPIEEVVRERNLTRVSKLASNENPLGPSPFAIREMTNGLWELHRYPDMRAFRLKLALSERYKLDPENIILGSGSEGIMSFIARAYIQPGDEIVTSDHSFVGFYLLARSAGASLVKVPLTDDYRYDVRAIAARVSDATKIVYIANPNNPTGTYITQDEFDFLMAKIPKSCLVLLDEAYFEYASSNKDYPDSMDYRYDNVITLRTFSKAFGLSGIRVGYGFGQKDLIAQLHKVKPPFDPNLIAQCGACGALDDSPHLERTLKENSAGYEVLFTFLKNSQLDPVASVTNFIMIPMGSAAAADWFTEQLLQQGVIIRPLSAFGMDAFVRVSIGTKNENAHFIEAVERMLPDFCSKFC